VGFSVLGEGDLDVDGLIAGALTVRASPARSNFPRSLLVSRRGEARSRYRAAGSRFNPQRGHSG
jgi:hypothetical protein